MTKSTKVLSFVPSPAVTIIPPWKVQFDSGVNNIPAINCTNIHNTSEEVWNCILGMTYNISEVILDEKKHKGRWRIELTDPHTGIYWSREDLFNMSTRRKDSYKIYINENISSEIVLHDPNFFAISSNPVTIPKFTKQGQKNEGWFFQLFLELTEVTNMNLPDNPCEASLSPSFTKCIKDFVIKV